MVIDKKIFHLNWLERPEHIHFLDCDGFMDVDVCQISWNYVIWMCTVSYTVGYTLIKQF